MSPKRRDYEDEAPPKHNFSFKKSTQSHHGGSSGRDVERGSESSGSDYIMDKADRKNFVFKVYLILSGYLLFAFIIVFAITYSDDAREFCNDYWWIGLIFSLVATIFYFILVCCPRVARSYPVNFVLLTIHNTLFSLFAAWFAAGFEIQVVWMAFLATGSITIVISLFAKFAPCDVTGCGIFFCIAFAAMAVISIIAIIVTLALGIRAKLLHFIIAIVMVILLSFYLMYITQLILGGRRGEFSPDDVVLAVIVLFTTIMDIFIYLLMLLQGCGDQD